MHVTSDVGPYGIVPLWLLEKHPSSKAIHLYTVLATKYANALGTSYPSRKTLAKDLGSVNEKTVDRATKELINLGALAVTKRSSPDGDWDSNVYMVKIVSPGGDIDVGTGGDIDVSLTNTGVLNQSESVPVVSSAIAPDTTGLDAPAESTPTSFPEWLLRIMACEKSNQKIAVLADALTTLTYQRPDYGRLGAIVKKQNNDHGYMLKLIWDLSSNRPAGNFLDYLQGTLKKPGSAPARPLPAQTYTNEEMAQKIRDGEMTPNGRPIDNSKTYSARSINPTSGDPGAVESQSSGTGHRR
jgi:hypothetical protein